MPKIAHTAKDMIANMTPQLQPGSYVFVSCDKTQEPALLSEAIASFQEAEGLSLILPCDVAERHGLPGAPAMQCITLNVYSSLEGVGLTAAVAAALGEAGIACNMVAAFHHDHVFVPETDSHRALAKLRELQNQATSKAD